MRQICRALSAELVGLDVTEPPSEFRIFKPGVNETSKGSVLFDAEAARDVMATWTREAKDMMLDLEHMSLTPPERTLRADSSDARAWFKLEVRSGELWAVDVRWTPDGKRRLAEKTQRYTSPAFLVDTETGRVRELLNVALVADPATYGAQPLVAASATGNASIRQVDDALIAALRAAYPPDDPDDYFSTPAFIDRYDDKVVFEQRGKLYAVTYSYAGGEAKLTGTPERVVRTYVRAAFAARVRAAKFLKSVRDRKVTTNGS